MQLVVGEQLNAPREMLLQHGNGKRVSRGLVRGDVVERLLECEAVQRPGSVREQGAQQIGDSFLLGRGLQVGAVLHGAEHGYGGAGGIGLDDEPDAVGQRGIGYLDVAGGKLEQ